MRSGFEEKVAADLKRRRIRYDYEPEKVSYTLACDYWPDFRLTNGVFVETKGVLTSSDRRKLRAVAEQHPDLDLRILFQRANNKLRRGSPTTYAMWAERYGFLWAEGKVPKEWCK